jgi:YidC/Oxa1 family membrane protein insertase
MKISQTGFSVDGSVLYAFISNPGVLTHMFVGVDLSHPSKVFAVLAAIAQFYQMKMLMRNQPKKEKKEGEQADFATIMNQQMLYMGPILTLWVGFTFAAALSLYWLVSTVFAIVQQWYMFHRKSIEPVK